VARGRLHAQNGIECQDRVGYCSKDGVFAIALSDGAGSYRNSSLGAEKITNNITKNLSIGFYKIIRRSQYDIKKRIIAEINRTLKSLQTEHSLPLKEFSCTLLFVVTDGKRFISGHIGDGVIGATKNKRAEVISKPENIIYANVTTFITGTNLLSHLRLFRGSLNGYDSFVLMSDGSSESLYDRKRNKLSKSIVQIKHWANIYTADKINLALKDNMEEYIIKNSFDDCSIIYLISVKKSHHQLRSLDKEFKKEFLLISNSLGVYNRMKVFYQIVNNKLIDYKIISKNTDLSERTVRKHYNAINKFSHKLIT
tara:strand:+ start:249 stop:1181 length:933 start_codon:yes stop_codon:yes gene_type:complete